MDILVTTPKAKHKLAEEEAKFVEENPNAFWFRTIRGKPNVEIGDKVYYVDNGQITGHGIVFDIENGQMQCESTGRVYRGTHLKQRKWVPLKKPISFRGFQGFRYVHRIAGLREKIIAINKELRVDLNYRFRYAYGVGGVEVDKFVEANPCVKDFLAKYKNSSASQFLSARCLCMFFKWLRIKKALEMSPAEFLNVLLKKRSSVKVEDRHWGRNLALQFSRDNPDFKGLADTYVRGKMFFPLKLFCDYHEVPLTSAKGLFGSCEPLKYDEQLFTVAKAKEVLAVLNQRDRAICMVMLQSGQSIRQVLVDVNRDAQYVFDEIDQGKQRIRLSFKQRKNNHFRYFSFISRDAIQELVKWRGERQERLDKQDKKSKWLFIDRRCKPLTPQQFQHNFKDLMRSHGIWTGPYTVRSHMFRKMFEQEASPPDRGISKLHVLFMMGHKAGKRLISRMDMVGGTYDKSPWIHKAVEQEYSKLEPWINLYSGKQVESVLQQENIELKKRVSRHESEIALIMKKLDDLLKQN